MPRATKGAAKKAAPAKKTTAKKAAPVKKTTVKKTVVKKAVPVKRATAKQAPVKKQTPAKGAAAKTQATAEKSAAVRRAGGAPKSPKKVVLDKFMLEQRDLLNAERERLVGQALELRAEADQIAAEMEPGDVQFDEESGEGTGAAIDRERDLALSMQAQLEVEEIDHALTKLAAGTYGTCERCGQAIPKPRLKAIPHARLCISCKSGGLSRR